MSDDKKPSQDSNAEPKAPARDRWKLEVTSSGRQGNYTLLIQATKNGVGKKDIQVALAGVFVGDEVNRTPISENSVIIGLDNNGFEAVNLSFKGKKRLVVVRIVGNQADNGDQVIRLKGATPRANGSGFLENFRKAIKANLGE